MKRALLPLIVGVAMCGTAANAAVTVTAADVPAVGPAPTYDFDTTIPTFVGGGIVNGSESGQYRQPDTGTGDYFSSGFAGAPTVPGTAGPATIDLSGFGDIGTISFLWGSLDDYNLLEFLDSFGSTLYSIAGDNPLIATGATLGTTTRLVTFNFSDAAMQQGIEAMRLTSNGANAFEIDNLAVQAVPEASTWMMLILGMLGVGFAMRRRTSESAMRVRYV
jgi:hypothetical protein